MATPRLTEVFLIKEAPKEMSFQQLRQKNPEAASEWVNMLSNWDTGEAGEEKNNPNDYKFAQDGLKITTSDGDQFWDPQHKVWDMTGNQPAKTTPPNGPPKLKAV